MFVRMIVFVLLVFVLAGCATSSKKQAAQSPSLVQKSSSPAYDDNDKWPTESYEDSAKQGSPGPVIQLSQKQIQRALKSAGFYQGPSDGKIGSKTKGAIVKFQKAKGLKAEGIVGKRTSTELNRYLSR